jgi:ketosteroid isomerase-like protein
MGLAACATVSTPATTEQELLAADRAFAARALEIGAGPAFVEFAADDVTIFPSAGVPETGKAAVEAWTSQWPEEMIVEWAPEAAHAGAGRGFRLHLGLRHLHTGAGRKGRPTANTSRSGSVRRTAAGSGLPIWASGAPAPEDR